MNIRRYIARHSIYIMLAATALTIGCQSKPQNQQPSAEEQKKMQQDYENAMAQQKQLTSGYGKSMQYVPPSTGYTPNQNKDGQKRQTAHQAAQQQKQQPQQSQPQQ